MQARREMICGVLKLISVSSCINRWSHRFCPHTCFQLPQHALVHIVMYGWQTVTQTKLNIYAILSHKAILIWNMELAGQDSVSSWRSCLLKWWQHFLQIQFQCNSSAQCQNILWYTSCNKLLTVKKHHFSITDVTVLRVCTWRVNFGFNWKFCSSRGNFEINELW